MAPAVSSPKRALLGALLGGLAGAAVVGLMALVSLPRVYRCSATVVFPLNASSTGGLGRALGLSGMAGLEVPNGSSFPLATYRVLLTSDQAIYCTAKKIRLNELRPNLTEPGIRGWFQRTVQVEINQDRSLVVTAKVRGTPSVQGISDLINRLPANQRDKFWRELGPVIINSLLDEMGRLADEFKIDQAKAELQAVEELITRQRQRRDDLQRRLDAVLFAKVSGDTPTYARVLTERFVAERGNLQKVEADLVVAKRRRQALDEQLDRQIKQVHALPEDVPFLSVRRADLARASQTFTQAGERYGPDSVQVQRAKSDLAYAQQQLREAMASAKLGLMPDLMAQDVQILALQAESEQRRKTVSSVSRDLVEATARGEQVGAVKDELDGLRDSIAQLEQRLAKARVDYETQGIRWKVISQPFAPRSKSAPSTMLALMIGFMAGAALVGAKPAAAWVMAVLGDLSDRPGT